MSDVAVDLKIDEQTLRQTVRLLKRIQGGAETALSQAVNDTLGPVKTSLNKSVRAEVALKKSDVDPLVKVNRAQPSDISGSVVLVREKVSLKRYSPKQLKAGVKVKIRKNEPKELIKHAFIATKLGDHVFIREAARGGRSRREKRNKNGRTYYTQLPIARLHGPTAVGVAAGEPGLIEKVQGEANERLENRVVFRTNRMLSKLK